MNKKQLYAAPETEVLMLAPESGVLVTVSGEPSRQSINEAYSGNGGLDVDW